MPNWQALLFEESAAPRSSTRGQAPSALPSSEIQRRIEAEATRQGVSPAVAVAIAKQESGLHPQAVGDNGKSLGLFQLQRAAAIDAGIDPDRRGELHENIRGGVTYFKQKLQQSGGSLEQALSRYNRGTPTYKGIGDPHYVEHVLGRMEGGRGGQAQGHRPARAAAGRDWGTELGLAPPGLTPSDGRSSMDWAQALFGTEAV